MPPNHIYFDFPFRLCYRYLYPFDHPSIPGILSLSALCHFLEYIDPVMQVPVAQGLVICQKVSELTIRPSLNAYPHGLLSGHKAGLLFIELKFICHLKLMQDHKHLVFCASKVWLGISIDVYKIGD